MAFNNNNNNNNIYFICVNTMNTHFSFLGILGILIEVFII